MLGNELHALVLEHHASFEFAPAVAQLSVHPRLGGLRNNSLHTRRLVLTQAGNWNSTTLGGEGLVVQLTGPGRVYIQTRSPESFVEWLVPQLPTTKTE